MKISDIISGNKPSLSFEVFPPKNFENFESAMKSAEEIAALSPSYMSVTYGAGGGTSDFTAEIADRVKSFGVEPLAHITCISSTREKVKSVLNDLKRRGIGNVLALRGDVLKDYNLPLEYKYASELIAEIKSFGDFCIGGACYPEGHPESKSEKSDIEALRIKAEAGCEFFTTQMFFDNDILYNFLYKLLKAGVNVPVAAGIMPVTNANQIKRIMSISGNNLPMRFVRLIDRYGDNPLAMKQAGIAYATEQIVDLYANGINAVHVYSMNKPDVAWAIKNNLSEIIK